MKFALFSDLHREVMQTPWEPTPLEVDAVILAGDIGRGTEGLSWAAKTFPSWPGSPEIIYVPGNHEYYREDLSLLEQMTDPIWAHCGIQVLERRSVVVAGVRILGCTLWSGFDLYGKALQETCMAAAYAGILDYQRITVDGSRDLVPEDTRRLYLESVAWLDQELAKPFAGKTMVVTHFAPHPRCVASQYQGGALTPYFVSDLSGVMEAHQIAVWCYGHTHTNIDFLTGGGCRVLSNQLGYPSEAENVGFRSHLIIDV